MTRDVFGSLMFLAGILAALGVVFNVLAIREHFRIRRYLHRPSPNSTHSAE